MAGVARPDAGKRTDPTRVRLSLSLPVKIRDFVTRVSPRFRRRSLRALQVEVTSRCTRICALCPRRALAGRWVSQDISAAAWAAIVPVLPLAEHVHLQGWGEPLLHPGLRDMALDAKRAGCSVGITTNGDLLTEAADWIVALGIDLVSISLAGGPSRHAAWRGGSDLAAVLGDAGALAAQARLGRPRVQLAYLLTRDNHVDLPEVVHRAADAGVHEIVITHLDCTPTSDLLASAAFCASGLRPDAAAALRAAQEVAARCDVSLRGPGPAPEEMLVCALDPTRIVFIAADGRVGPCTYQLLPVAGPIPRAGFDGTLDIEPDVFGVVPEQTLEEVLGSPARSCFIGPLRARLVAEKGFLSRGLVGFGAAEVAALEEADAERARALAHAPLPPSCTGCHKKYGW